MNSRLEASSCTCYTVIHYRHCERYIIKLASQPYFCRSDALLKCIASKKHPSSSQSMTVIIAFLHHIIINHPLQYVLVKLPWPHILLWCWNTCQSCKCVCNIDCSTKLSNIFILHIVLSLSCGSQINHQPDFWGLGVLDNHGNKACRII